MSLIDRDRQERANWTQRGTSIFPRRLVSLAFALALLGMTAAVGSAEGPSDSGEDPLLRHLEDVDDVMILNPDGKKFKIVEFSHRKHAVGEFSSGVTCQTCHHTQEDDSPPVGCNECHELDGDADEKKTKKRSTHKKGLSFPMDSDQEEISCVSCHKALNKLLAAGEREGEKAPSKCTQCHVKNK
ncbi:MAG: cytochrome c3 family protein [Myxococcota bacterium]